MAVMPLASPETSTGVNRALVVPSPSSPSWLYPQHLTPPALVSAQVWEPPAAAMAVTPLVRPDTGRIGTGGSIPVPSPCWPQPSAHQHSTPPPLVTAPPCNAAAA